jgi:hypothetical protein
LFHALPVVDLANSLKRAPRVFAPLLGCALPATSHS